MAYDSPYKAIDMEDTIDVNSFKSRYMVGLNKAGVFSPGFVKFNVT